MLSAAIVLGATVAYAVAISLAERAPEHLAFTIGAVRRSDRVLAIPAFLVALVTGLWLALDARLPLDRPWLAASLALYFAILITGFTVFGPTVRRQLAVLARGGAGEPAYARLRARARMLSYGTIAGLVAIFALMIAKPA